MTPTPSDREIAEPFKTAEERAPRYMGISCIALVLGTSLAEVPLWTILGVWQAVACTIGINLILVSFWIAAWGRP